MSGSVMALLSPPSPGIPPGRRKGRRMCQEMSGSVMALLSSPFPVIPTGAAVRPRTGGIPAQGLGSCWRDRAEIPPLPSVGRDDGGDVS